jgi:transposase
MKLHSNAKLTPKSRLALAQSIKRGEMTVEAAAAASNVSTRTARKWLNRFQTEGAAGLQERSLETLSLKRPQVSGR